MTRFTTRTLFLATQRRGVFAQHHAFQHRQRVFGQAKSRLDTAKEW